MVLDAVGDAGLRGDRCASRVQIGSRLTRVSLPVHMARRILGSFGSLGDVRRAGDVLRRALSARDPVPSVEEVRGARQAVEAYRSAHAAPMHAAYMGLRSCLSTEGLHADLSRRLKRLPTIEDKLRRLPRMDVSSMQDIGGCRAVLDSQEGVARVVSRFCANSLRRNGQPDKIRDYVSQPQASGYRAIHIHTRYHGRRIEVQLRTREQDSWAKIVEDLTSRTGIDIKNGDGPEEIHVLLRRLSELLSITKPPRPSDDELQDILTRLAMVSGLGHAVRSTHQGRGEG